MFKQNELKERLRKGFSEKQATLLAEVLYDITDELVKAKDFNELKEIVKDLAKAQKELAEAQRRTEERVEELAEAQKRTEKRVEELAEAQKRTEERIEELAEAQKRTEERVEELAEAQKRTEKRVEELAEAQKRTEEELQKLIVEHKETRKQLGGLSITVGYRLEDNAFKALPKLLKQDFGLEIIGKLKRTYVTDKDGKPIEVNIIGEAVKDGERFIIIGEGKAQLSKNDINKFIKKKLKKLEGVFERIFPLIVTYMISEPNVDEYARKKGIKVYYSYEF